MLQVYGNSTKAQWRSLSRPRPTHGCVEEKCRLERWNAHEPHSKIGSRWLCIIPGELSWRKEKNCQDQQMSKGIVAVKIQAAAHLWSCRTKVTAASIYATRIQRCYGKNPVDKLHKWSDAVIWGWSGKNSSCGSCDCFKFKFGFVPWYVGRSCQSWAPTSQIKSKS